MVLFSYVNFFILFSFVLLEIVFDFLYLFFLVICFLVYVFHCYLSCFLSLVVICLFFWLLSPILRFCYLPLLTFYFQHYLILFEWYFLYWLSLLFPVQFMSCCFIFSPLFLVLGFFLFGKIHFFDLFGLDLIGSRFPISIFQKIDLLGSLFLGVLL